MNPDRIAQPALGHSGSMGCPPPPTNESHNLPYLEVPTVTSPGWWSILAGTGMPRRNSVGFSENYVSDTAPPFCLDEDSSQGSGLDSSSTLKPPNVTRCAQSPPVRRKENQTDFGVPSPSDEFLTQYWSKHHGSGRALLDAETLDGSKISVFVSQHDDDSNCVTTAETLLLPPSHHQHHSHPLNVPISTKIAESIHMEDFPVVTRESLAQLDKLKKEILATTFEAHPLVERVTQDMASAASADQKSLDNKEFDHQVLLSEKEVEKPPSKLVSFIMSQPFTQNWFFQNPNHSEESEENPSVTTESRKSRLRQMNVWAPQNL